jgi:hypothetical protein
MAERVMATATHQHRTRAGGTSTSYAAISRTLAGTQPDFRGDSTSDGRTMGATVMTYDAWYVDSAKLCRLPRCELQVMQDPTRYVLIYQHGDNPEHRFEMPVNAWRPGDGFHPALEWLNRVHEYEAQAGAVQS